MIKDPQAMHGGSGWCWGVMLMNTPWNTHTDTNALVKQGALKRGGGGEGGIPVIDINGFKSPELTF